MMITACRRFAATCTMIVALGSSACDGGSPSRTADEFAADSALAADLALANRDTLLVDSIGAYRPSRDTLPTEAIPERGAEFDDSISASPSVRAATPPSPPTPRPAAPAPAAPPASAAPASEPKAARKTAPAPRLSGSRACASPTLQNQSECLRALLPAADAR